MNTNLLIALLAFGAGLPLTWGAITLGERRRLLDLPTTIKPHARPIPYTGCAPIAAIAAMTALIMGLLPVAVGVICVWAIGLVDDLRSLPPRTKLALEVLPLLLVGGAIDLSPATIALAVIVGVILVNVFNVIDGLDGLAAGCALAPLIVLQTSDTTAGHFAAAVAGSVLAFLLFNRHPARVFLGDQGSLVLGFLLWALPLVQSVQMVNWPGAAVWVLLWLFPLVNAGYVIAFRLTTRRPIMRGDRSHLYDMLHRRFGLRTTLVACWSIAIAGAIGALVVGVR